MSLTIVWHPEAEEELGADVGWYEDRDPGLGDRLEVAVLDAVDDAVGTPDVWPPCPGWEPPPPVRSKGVAGFPCRAVYFADDDLLTIVAVAHARRRPGYWRARVTP